MSFFYLASPYSKYHRGIEEAFREAARQAAILTRAGVPVFSPIAHTHPVAQYGNIDPLDHAIWLPVDTPMMQAAEKGLIVCEMEGWRESYGVQKEIEFFQARGRRIVQMIPGVVPEEVRPVRRKVVGLAGYATCGKDTAARGLAAQLWQVVSFSEPLCESLLALDPWVEIDGRFIRISDLWAEHAGDWVAMKRIPEVRQLLQRQGTEAGREIHGGDCWVNLARKKIDATSANIVITNVRFPEEAEMVRSYGGIIVWVDRPGVRPVNGHKSDAGLVRDLADHIIVNDGSERELQAKLRALCHDSPENVACGA